MVPVKMMVIVMAVATVRYDDAFVCCTPCDACCIMYDDVDDDDGDGERDGYCDVWCMVLCCMVL